MLDKSFLGFETKKKWDYENGFYLTSDFVRIPKLLAHYELYKSIQALPGHIVEFGVFKGASFIRFCTFRDMLESPYSRKVIGFDAFGKFPSYGDESDVGFINKFEKEAGEGISVRELSDSLKEKGVENFELIQGDIKTTLPKYVEEHLELKISLLHIDVDVYEPTMTVLENCFDRVVSGGIIMMDDYGTVPGETRAIDDFLRDKNLLIEKLPISHIPAYIRIP
tara:strand:- start:39 stop:707 length:669 start_codon:yes stop_codon:yes gene_type:complete